MYVCMMINIIIYSLCILSSQTVCQTLLLAGVANYLHNLSSCTTYNNAVLCMIKCYREACIWRVRNVTFLFRTASLLLS
jgi:hypothetical protein